MSDTETNLPAALEPLMAQRCWLIWRWETGKNGKPTKVPYQAARPDQKASSTNPNTWSDFSTAQAAAKQANGNGFCLVKSDIAAFDLDDCRDPETGTVDPWAMKLIERCRSYVEITPSQTGLRIIGTAGGERIHRKLQVGRNGMSVELFRRAERYITVTGDVHPESATELADIGAIMDEVLIELGAEDKIQFEGSAFDTVPTGHVDPYVEELVAEELPRDADRSNRFAHAVKTAVECGMTATDFETLCRKHPKGCACKYMPPKRRDELRSASMKFGCRTRAGWPPRWLRARGLSINFWRAMGPSGAPSKPASRRPSFLLTCGTSLILHHCQPACCPRRLNNSQSLRVE